MNTSDFINDSKEFKDLLGINILRITTDSIIVSDLNGEIVFWNKGAETIFGYHEDETLGKTLEFIYPGMDMNIVKKDLNNIINGKDFIGEWKGKSKEGNEVWVNIHSTTMRNHSGKVIGFIGVAKDITQQKLLLKKLSESETKYQTIFENSGEGFFLMRDKFIDVNKKVCEIFGFKKEEIIGKSPIDFSPERQSDGTLSNEKALTFIKKALNEGYVSFYWQHINKSKKIIDAHISLNRVYILGESYLIAIMHDMTEFLKYQNKLKSKTKELAEKNKKVLLLNDELNEYNARLKIINKQIEANERKFRVAFKTSPDSVNINRMSDGLFTEINEGFTMLTGYTEDDVKGKTSYDINIWADSKDRDELVKRLKRDEYVSNLEAQFRKKDGSLTTALMSASIIEIKNKKHILSITRDISVRKDYEEKLKDAMKKAEESDMLKSAFLANMSHEIRTPMNAILGFGQLLKEKKVDKKKQEKFLDIIISRSHNLLQIINDIVDISKIEANQLEIEKQEFSLNKLLYELYSSFEAELITQNEKNVKILFKADSLKTINSIYSDELRLKQIFTNLISNAIKFTDKGKVEFGYTVKNNELEFFVADTGIGIPKESHEYIFERFRQADGSSTREFGGTGLGLSISKQLVELLGGRIWVDSDRNKGAIFYFTIPCNSTKIEKDHKNDKSETNLDLTGKSILIVEDDFISMTYLEELLLNTNATILKAYNGLKAVEMVESNEKIDLILMDINMPKMSGNEATQKIKKIRNTLPVIAQSAFAMPKDKKESFKNGCDDYITKPIESTILFDALRKYLQN